MKVCGIDIPSSATVLGMWGTTHEAGIDVLFVAVRWDAATHRIVQRFRYEDSGEKSVTVFEVDAKTDEQVFDSVSGALSSLFDLGYSRGCRIPLLPAEMLA